MTNNKVAIFSDLHLGIKQDSPSWHNIALEWCDWFVSELINRNIKQIIFLGDFFHTRNTISANTLHVASELLDKLSAFNLHFILGNHDLYYANDPTISPVNLFSGRHNIKVYQKPEIVTFGTKKALMCGWGYEPTNYIADVLFTHAEINTFKYNSEVGTCEEGMRPSELLKHFDIIYSGHFHLNQEKQWQNKKIIYVGNTFSMDHSDKYMLRKGFEIFDFDTFKNEFVENLISPKFYKIYLSELGENKWSYEELDKIIPNNIIKLIINKDITITDNNLLTSIFNSFNPLGFTTEWENIQNFDEEVSFEEIRYFDIKDAIIKYIEMLDISEKMEVTNYLLELYEKAQV